MDKPRYHYSFSFTAERQSVFELGVLVDQEVVKQHFLNDKAESAIVNSPTGQKTESEQLRFALVKDAGNRLVDCLYSLHFLIILCRKSAFVEFVSSRFSHKIVKLNILLV